MKVPVQITVGGKKIAIQYVNEPENVDAGGAENGGAGPISVNIAQNATEREVFATLFHELIHVAFERTGHSAEWTDAQEEPLVYALENMLAALFCFRKDAAIRYKEIDWEG